MIQLLGQVNFRPGYGKMGRLGNMPKHVILGYDKIGGVGLFGVWAIKT